MKILKFLEIQPIIDIEHKKQNQLVKGSMQNFRG